MTASSAWFDQENFHDLGFDSYLFKPFHIEDLKQVLVQTKFKDIKQEDKPIEVDSVLLRDKFPDSAILQEIKKIAKLNPSIDFANFMVDIIDEYLRELPTLLGNLDAAFENNSINEVVSISHKFASCSANLGAEELTNLSQDLESTARDKNTLGMKNKIQQVISEYERVKLFLVRERQQYSI